MSQHYSDPARANDPHALPDIEVFYIDEAEALRNRGCDDGTPMAAGWYWWRCFPGCLPEGDGHSSGPFDTEAEAAANAKEQYDD